MTPEVARILLAFLSRTELRGAEAAQFLQVVRVVEEIANQQQPQTSDPPVNLRPVPAARE